MSKSTEKQPMDRVWDPVGGTWNYVQRRNPTQVTGVPSASSVQDLSGPVQRKRSVHGNDIVVHTAKRAKADSPILITRSQVTTPQESRLQARLGMAPPIASVPPTRKVPKVLQDVGPVKEEEFSQSRSNISSGITQLKVCCAGTGQATTPFLLDESSDEEHAKCTSTVLTQNQQQHDNQDDSPLFQPQRGSSIDVSDSDKLDFVSLPIAHKLLSPCMDVDCLAASQDHDGHTEVLTVPAEVVSQALDTSNATPLQLDQSAVVYTNEIRQPNKALTQSSIQHNACAGASRDILGKAVAGGFVFSRAQAVSNGRSTHHMVTSRTSAPVASHANPQFDVDMSKTVPISMYRLAAQDLPSRYAAVSHRQDLDDNCSSAETRGCDEEILENFKTEDVRALIAAEAQHGLNARQIRAKLSSRWGQDIAQAYRPKKIQEIARECTGLDIALCPPKPRRSGGVARQAPVVAPTSIAAIRPTTSGKSLPAEWKRLHHRILFADDPDKDASDDDHCLEPHDSAVDVSDKEEDSPPVYIYRVMLSQARTSLDEADDDENDASTSAGTETKQCVLGEYLDEREAHDVAASVSTKYADRKGSLSWKHNPDDSKALVTYSLRTSNMTYTSRVEREVCQLPGRLDPGRHAQTRARLGTVVYEILEKIVTADDVAKWTGVSPGVTVSLSAPLKYTQQMTDKAGTMSETLFRDLSDANAHAAAYLLDTVILPHLPRCASLDRYSLLQAEERRKMIELKATLDESGSALSETRLVGVRGKDGAREERIWSVWVHERRVRGPYN